MTEGGNNDKCTHFSKHQHLLSPANPGSAQQFVVQPRPSSCQSVSRSSQGLDVAGVSFITAVSIIILSRFNDYGLTNLLEEFPVRFALVPGYSSKLTAFRQTCNTSIRDQPSPLIPHILQPLAACELLIFELCLLTSLHWYIVFSLFGRGRWKERYMTSVGTMTIAGTVFCGMIVRDQAALFLVVTPLIMDLTMLSCWLLDWVMAHE